MAKRIGIISDTHNLLRPEVLEILKGCDCILHAGDVTKESLLDQIRFLGNLYVVRGNNDGDWARGIAKVLTFQIEGVSFVMAHEWRHLIGQTEGTNVAVFGHTLAESRKLRISPVWRCCHHGGDGSGRGGILR